MRLKISLQIRRYHAEVAQRGEVPTQTLFRCCLLTIKRDELVQKCNEETKQRCVSTSSGNSGNSRLSYRQTVECVGYCTLYYNQAQEQIRSGTTLHDEVEQEAQGNYYNAEDIQDEYSGIEDIQHIFVENETQLLEDENRVKIWRFNNF